MHPGQAFALPVKAPSMKRIKVVMARVGLFIHGALGPVVTDVSELAEALRGRLRAGGGIGEMRPMRLP